MPKVLMSNAADGMPFTDIDGKQMRVPKGHVLLVGDDGRGTVYTPGQWHALTVACEKARQSQRPDKGCPIAEAD